MKYNHRSQRQTSPPRPDGFLHRLARRQMTGLPLSQCKALRRYAVQIIDRTVRPKKLLSLVEEPALLHGRVFLGFLSGGHWLVVFKSTEEEETDRFMFDDVHPHNFRNGQSPAAGVLEFWIYHPNKPLKLRHSYCLFNELESPYSMISAEDCKFSVYQWLEKPDHILVVGEKTMDDAFERNTDEEPTVMMSMSYLPVPSYSEAEYLNCPLCCRAKGSLTFSCIKHQSRIDFFYSRDYHDGIKPKANLTEPDTIYMVVSGAMIYQLQIRIGTVSESDVVLNEQKTTQCDPKETMSGEQSKVYTGMTTSENLTVKHGLKSYDEDFTISCCDMKGRHFIPSTGSDLSQVLQDKTICMVVRRSWVSIYSLIRESIEPRLSTVTRWYKTKYNNSGGDYVGYAVLDWITKYIQICRETGVAVCEVSAKFSRCRDLTEVDKVKNKVVSARIAWDPSSTVVDILDIDRGITSFDEVEDEENESLTSFRSCNPTWFSICRVEQNYSVPCDDPIHTLSNAPFVQGKSLNQLSSIDHTSVVCL